MDDWTKEEVVDDGDEETETTDDGVDMEMFELLPEEFEVIIGSNV